MARYGLYAHVPFCHTKCGYCDFYSVALNNRPTSPLVSALAAELGRRTSDTDVDIRTIFVGGGTPTVLPHSDLQRLMAAFQAITTMNDVVEFTVEANPATLDDEKLSILTGAGVQRISLGCQSWHKDELATLERLHAP
ncbi:MAG: radical SAM protein, partial [Planctomycetes bacterium]|nr:radical SAM protein [Planctomycetota bacterium]